MAVISKTIIQAFIQKHPDAENAMEKWYGDTKGATWKNFSEVKRTFNAADSF
ncbi:MAG TPA: type II toxin-antitoxin system HigB family toxin [Parafilimonas sp.]|jgi:mRNA interferase HigB|nr:type II toxin-antitoxin system HigB family toxin [Parafilimonas sp.]